jgi:hypothetical protein
MGEPWVTPCPDRVDPLDDPVVLELRDRTHCGESRRARGRCHGEPQRPALRGVCVHFNVNWRSLK